MKLALGIVIISLLCAGNANAEEFVRVDFGSDSPNTINRRIEEISNYFDHESISTLRNADHTSFETVLNAVQDRMSSIGLNSALAKLCLVEASLQLGQKSVDGFVEQSNKNAGRNPKNSIDEQRWLKLFLNAYQRESEDAAGGASRVDFLKALLTNKNLELDGPIYLNLENKSPETIVQ